MLFFILPSQYLTAERVMGSPTQIWTIIPIPLNQCVQWQWKWLYSQRALTFISMCITLDLVWGALHLLSYLIPITLSRAKPSIKPRYIGFQRPHPFHYTMLPLQRKKKYAKKNHQRNRKDNHFPRIGSMTYLSLQFPFLPFIFQRPFLWLSQHFQLD